MAGRRREPAAFRPSVQTRPSHAPSRRQAIAMVAALVLVASGIAVASYVVKPNKARAFDLFYGSVFLKDERAPVAVDLTNGKPTVRLVDADTQVSAKNPNDLAVSPMVKGTLLLNAATGEFNMVDATGFVVKTTGGGVPLPKRAGPTRSIGIPAGASAYIVQTGASGTSVFLVGQTTVQSATGQGARVRPRASTTMTAPGSTSAGAADSANGDLWLLVGPPGSRTIRQLSVPHGSDAGATLATTDHGAVTGVAAIGVAKAPGGDVVGVASADSVRIFGADGKSHTAAVTGLDGVDQILPVANSVDRLSFLYHSAAGWTVVSVGADGAGLTGHAAVDGIAPTVRLAAPAASRGQLYTMEVGGTGRIWQIGTDGAARQIDGASAYPVVKDSTGHALEAADFSDAYVIARSSRVVFNSPNHVQALALFTDGSRRPAVIDKSAAVSLNAAGGATSVTDAHIAKGPKKPPKPGQKPVPQPAQPINNEIRCKTIKQVPHIPTIIQATPGSRSAQLQWTYPLLDTQDCAPSTYTVSVRLLSAAAPPPPASVTVQGQDGVNLTGLFPSTRYEITVTAFINGTGTPSAPVQVTTGPEGPAAPTNVAVRTDSTGNWTITWTSCGGVRQGCVPSTTWNVVPQLCDGLPGLSSAPATISVAGDPTQHSFSARYPGTDALLGHGLSFQVIGIGEQGTVGTPASAGGCAFSWSTPVENALTITASQPSNTSLGGSATTTVTVSLGPNAVHDVGGVGAQVRFHLTGPAGTQTNGPVTFTGSSTQLATTFRGVQAGAQYIAQATVSAPKHPEAAVTVGPVTVETRANWPGLSVTGSCPPDRGLIVISCTLTVNIDGISSANANGERFDLADGSGVQCGNTGFRLDKQNFDPSQEAIVADHVSLLVFHGTCTVTVVLTEDRGSRPPLVFGGIVSPSASVAVDLGSASKLNAKQSDFAAAWDSTGGASNVNVKYQGSLGDQDVAQITTGWSEIVKAPNGTTCGSDNEQPTSRGIDIPVNPTCVNRYGGVTSGWSVTVSYHDQSDGQTHSMDPYSLSGGPPTYQPCTVVATDFTATWTGTSAMPAVNVTFGGDQSKLAGCTDWVYHLTDPGGAACGSASPQGGPPGGATIPLSCATAPSENDWSVTITYTDTAGDPQTVTPSLTVGGPVPP